MAVKQESDLPRRISDAVKLLLWSRSLDTKLATYEKFEREVLSNRN